MPRRALSWKMHSSRKSFSWVRGFIPPALCSVQADVEALSSVLSEKAWLWEQVTGRGFTVR